jgi:hypothetical protein
MPFDISLLLASTHATLAPSSGGTVAITIAPVSAPHPAPYAVRCAASIQATVHLDPATFHPTLIEGRVAGSGCNATFQPSLHFESLTREPLITQFRAGATIRIVYGLQKDKFDNPANSFWLITEQHYDYPWRNSSAVLYYWGRELPVNVARASRLVRNARITAREFGAGSLIRFDRDPPQ